MIVTISLIVLLICFPLIALNPKVDIKWPAKLVMCFGIMHTVGALSSGMHRYDSQSGLFAVIAFLFAYATYTIYRTGTYK